MPKISTAKSSKDEMSAATQGLRVAVKKTSIPRRTISSAVVIAASATGSSKRNTKKTEMSQSSAAISLDKVTKGVIGETVIRDKEAIRTDIETLEEQTMHKSWYDVLNPEFGKPYFKKLKQFLIDESTANTVYPPMEQIYSWSRLTPLDRVKVVVLGQDPYHDVGQAHGLSFSVLPPTKPPGSLKNIYKQLSQDVAGFTIPTCGDLSRVAELGVLWLNTSLTVRAHKAGSHSKKGWESFTAEVLRQVLARKNRPGVVFMAWGLPAQKTCDSIGIDEKKHLVLKSAHPSPLSAHRGFLGNGHFKKANEWLEENHGAGSGINWKVLGAKTNQRLI